MPFYEVIYETGAHSVLFADSDEGIKEGLKEQHRRAVNGEPGQLPTSSTPHSTTGEHSVATHAAERVKRVLVYPDGHPGDGPDFTTAPRVPPEDKHAHASNYVMPESHEMPLDWLEADTGGVQ